MEKAQLDLIILVLDDLAWDGRSRRRVFDLDDTVVIYTVLQSENIH